MREYLACLLLVAGPWALFSRGPVARCASVLIANWMAGYLFNDTFGTTTPWFWSFMVDTASAIWILRAPAGKWQAAIAGTYMAQIIMHFIYAVGGFAAYFYWQQLTVVAYLQLGLLFFWGINGTSRNIASGFRDRPHRDLASHNRDMGGR